MTYQFEDYKIVTGRTKMDKPFATINEFASLIATGESTEDAINNLRQRYKERVAFYLKSGKPIPAPGSGTARVEFAPDNKIRELGLIVEDFWENILGTSLATSFVSNESHLSSWEHYCGGREVLIRKVKQRYGIDISTHYSKPIPIVLKRIKDGAGWKALNNERRNGV